jgi:surfeit locus 1 family protein
LPVPDLRKIASFRGSAGYELIAPFLTSDNIVILVDRGTIPYDASDGTYSPASLAPATVTGILRAHDKGQGYFDGDNDAEGNQWIWWDIPAMLGAVPVPADATVSRLILQRLPDESLTLPPIISAPKAELRNNHLGYAITWFGLAAALLVVAIAFLLKRTDKK